MKHLFRVVLISVGVICGGSLFAHGAPEGESIDVSKLTEVASSPEARDAIPVEADSGLLSVRSVNHADSALMLLSGAGLIGLAQVVRRTRKER